MSNTKQTEKTTSDSRAKAAALWEEYAVSCERWADYLDTRGEGGDTYRRQAKNARLTAASLVSALVLLLLSACGDNPCGCPLGTVCQPMPSKEGYACIPAPQAQDSNDAR